MIHLEQKFRKQQLQLWGSYYVIIHLFIMQTKGQAELWGCHQAIHVLQQSFFHFVLSIIDTSLHCKEECVLLDNDFRAHI